MKSRRQISIALTAVALLLWIHGLLFARFDIGYWGLIHGLPLSYFIALAFLTAASVVLWFDTESHQFLLCLQLIIFIAAIWLIPLIVGGSPPFTDHSYRNLGMTDYIIRTGQFNPMATEYLSWPGVFFIAAMLCELAAVELRPVLTAFPFIMQLLCLFPLYLFLRNSLGEANRNYYWAGAWFYFLANWVASLYFSPQAIAYFLLLTSLALLAGISSLKTGSGSRNYILLGLAVIIVAAMAITHFLTALAALSVFGLISLVKRSKIMVLLTGICGLLVVLWALTGAGLWVNVILSNQEFVTTSAEVVGSREVIAHLGGSASHAAVALSRLPFSAIFALFGFSGAIVALLVRRKFAANIPILAMAVAPFLLFPLSVNYAGEFTTRLYLFALAPMAYFTVKLLEMRNRVLTVILCLVLAIGPAWHVVAHYGNEAMDHLSPAGQAGPYFFHDNVDEGYFTGSMPMGVLKNVEYYQELLMEQLYAEDGLVTMEAVPGREIDQDLPHYIVINQQEREYHDFFTGTSEFIGNIEARLGTVANYYITYDNADSVLFFNESIDQRK